MEARDDNGNTPLKLAVMYNRNSVVVTAALLEAGADIEAPTETEWVPLHFAAYAGNPAVITELLDAGADTTKQSDFGETVWSLAQDNPELVGTAVYKRLRALAGE